jgi:hypothetical protein
MASSATPLAAGTAAAGTDNAKFAREGHVHPVQTTVSGNAGTATKWATARTLSLTGGVTGSVSIDGSANAAIATTIAGNAPTATKLATARSLKTSLGSTTAVTFDGSAAQDAIPVTGTLGVANGGTGQTTAALARSALGLGNTTGALPVANGGTGLTAAPSLLTNLASTTAASPLAASPRPGVTGTLPVGNGGTGNTTGLAATATKLATARTIALTGDVTASGSFDGSANLSLAATGVQAAKLKTARTIALSGKATGTATSFDGSANISIPVTAVTDAAKLTTARTIALTGAVTGSVSFDGSASASITTAANPAVFRTMLTAAKTFYLSRSGSNSNNGTTSALAMLDFNSLITRLYQEYDLNRQTITISIAAGTWTNQAWAIYPDKMMNSGAIVINGAGVDQTILSASDGTTTARNGLSIYGPRSAYSVQVKNMTFTNCTSCLVVGSGVTVQYANLKFGPHFTANSGFDISVANLSYVAHTGGSASALVSLNFAGGAKPPQYCVYVANGAYMNFDYTAVTISHSAASTGFLRVVADSFCYVQAAARTTFTGTVTGRRAVIEQNSWLYIAGRGESCLPGTTVSTCDGYGSTIDGKGGVYTSSGTSATSTGFKLANGTDIGTLFATSAGSVQSVSFASTTDTSTYKNSIYGLSAAISNGVLTITQKYSSYTGNNYNS